MAIKGGCEKFLRKKKEATNFKSIVKNMVTSLKNLGCQMSLKLYFLHSVMCMVNDFTKIYNALCNLVIDRNGIPHYLPTTVGSSRKNFLKNNNNNNNKYMQNQVQMYLN